MGSYFDTGVLKYLYFLIILALYICIIGANVLLIVVICVNRSLHEPMYLFLCSLFVNELCGSTGVSLQLCGNIINKVYCDNYSIVKLACSDTT
ncbi:olfactory receptor 5M5-like, partial [Pseudochaenichthys georgianus]|uniref:olfactory receptor 5M5-like n=1 Tax=Pseudochaenichthys georgianus TaxID=52239 RepID=UPI0039C1600B